MRCYLAGHNGMVGSALLRDLRSKGADVIVRTRAELDLTDQGAVRSFMRSERPDTVILAAAKVGGIVANNSFPASFIYENLSIQTNVIHEAFRADVQRLLFLGSSCIYPRDAPQPIPENALLSGALEKTNEPYAIAKIAGIKLCESYNRQYGTDYRCVMPSNLYGPGDNFHPTNAHALPAMLRRFHEAVQHKRKEVVVWGTGRPRREFLYVEDMARASLFVFALGKSAYDLEVSGAASHVNVGTGQDVSIAELARLIAEVTGFHGSISFDESKPDGTPRKLLDVSIVNKMGWKAEVGLEAGLKLTYRWFLNNSENLRVA